MTEESLNTGKALLIEINSIDVKIAEIDQMITATNVDSEFIVFIKNSERSVNFECRSQESFLDFLNARKTALNTLKTSKQTEFDNL